MTDKVLNQLNHLANEIFDLLKLEYKTITKKRTDLFSSLDLENFFKITSNIDLHHISFINGKYYIQENEISMEFLKKHLLLFCLIALVPNRNPLIMGLIELEVFRLSAKYEFLESEELFSKEREVVTILSSVIPFYELPEILFLESDIEVFYYLVSELGFKKANFYHEISILMQNKYEQLRDPINVAVFLQFYENLNYEDIKEKIYENLSLKVK